jgi:hypothetical protein
MRLSQAAIKYGINFRELMRDRYFVIGYFDAQDQVSFQYNLNNFDLASYERGRHFYQIYPYGLKNMNALEQFIEAVKEDLIV